MPSRWEVSSSVLWRVIVILAGIIYGTLHHYSHIPQDVNDALTVTLLFLLVEQFVEIGHRLERAAGAPSNPLPKLRGICSTLLTRVRADLANTLRPSEDGFTVANPAEAIVSYENFWELLNEEQQRTTRSARTLTVFAIHSCEVDIWVDHPLSARLLDLQREFGSLGGKITRVLCGRGQHPDQRLCRACANMRDAGVEVRYYNIDSKLVEHTWAWDFLYVNENGQSVVWTALFHAGGVIAEATYSHFPSYKSVQLPELGKNILRHSVDFPASMAAAGS